jgi:hypothetical protein
MHVRENDIIAKAVEAGQWDRVIDYVNREVFEKPEEYLQSRQASEGRGRGPPHHPARDP